MSFRFATATLLAATLSMLAGCTLSGEGTGDDGQEQDLERAAEGVTSCTIRTATGYRYGSSFTIKVVTIDGKPVELNTAMAYVRMQNAAAKAGVKIWINSGFRTMAQQRTLYAMYLNGTGNLAARPGYSNHQSGHALDINTAVPSVWSWMSRNGGRYGFKRTVPSEAWHWEYWGPAVAGPCTDADKDGIVDGKDNCPKVANKAQTDLDKDGKGDVCDGDVDGDGVANSSDNCAREKNASQTDGDGDGKGDACDLDDDQDGVPDTKDNCPRVKNAEQEDADGDGKGDACDTDRDGDGLANEVDNCPDDENADQADEDGDAKGDLCDEDPPLVSVDPPAASEPIPDDTDPVPPGTEDCGDDCGGGNEASTGEGADLQDDHASEAAPLNGSCASVSAKTHAQTGGASFGLAFACAMLLAARRRAAR